MKRSLISVLIAAILLTAGSPAMAKERDGTSAETTDIELDAHAHSGGQVAVSDSPWGKCDFESMSIEVFVQKFFGVIVHGIYGGLTEDDIEFVQAVFEGYDLTEFDYEGELQGFNDVVCPEGVLFEGRAIWPVGTQTPQVVIDAVTEIARSRLTITSPTPQTAPTGTLEAPTVVNLPTFLWIDQAAWAPSSETAEIPGLVSVTVTATPTSVTWDLGDGSTPITCDGPGTPWEPGLESTDCQHTYERSSADQPGNQYTLRATTHYDITTTCTPLAANTSCGSTAPFGGVNLTYTDTMAVAEVQAVNT